MLPSYLLNRPFLPLATDRLTLGSFLKRMQSLWQPWRMIKGSLNDLSVFLIPIRFKMLINLLLFTQDEIQKGSSISLAIIRRVDQTFMGVIGLKRRTRILAGAGLLGAGVW